MHITRNLEILGGSKDGKNFEVTYQEIKVGFHPDTNEEDEVKVVVSGITGEDTYLTITEIESLLDDMKYLQNKG